MYRIASLAAAAMIFLAAPANSQTIESYIQQKCLNTYGQKKAKEKASYYAPIIERKARQYGIDPLLVASLVWHESNFNHREVSHYGARGLCQVMPMWFHHYGVPLSAWKDPEANLDVALRLYTFYRGRMRGAYPGISDTDLDHRTLVSYNQGPVAVSRGVYRSRYSRLILKDTRSNHAERQHRRPFQPSPREGARRDR